MPGTGWPHTCRTAPVTRPLADRRAARSTASPAPWSFPPWRKSERLFATLASLAANPPELLARFLVLVVVNHREDAPSADKEDNRRDPRPPCRCGMPDLALSAGSPGSMPPHPAWKCPPREAGSGLPARSASTSPCSDSATPEGGPAPRLPRRRHPRRPDLPPRPRPPFPGSRGRRRRHPLRHQPGSRRRKQRAIDRYELFLRHYVLGLKLAGSPYAFHTVGSAMACTADAYVRRGGMNTRAAGEDFYFLQHLSRTVGSRPGPGDHRLPFPAPVPPGTVRHRPLRFPLAWRGMRVRSPSTGRSASAFSEAGCTLVRRSLDSRRR